MLQVFAPAKINLCLHVTGQRSDGYHLLDSLVGFATVGDVLTLRRSEPMGLDVIGPEGGHLSGGDNIITRTMAAFGATGVHITLDKRLPVASGIGGGSADAAAAYRGLCALLGRGHQPSDMALLLNLGADVPMCAACVPARVQGIGELITPLPQLAPLWAVLVNPRVPVATPAVFRALGQKINAPLSALPQRLKDATGLLAWLAAQRNDLQAPAMAIAPPIAQALAALTYSGAALARMSGSGATCFGLYTSQAAAQAAAQDLARQQPDWWVAQTQINAPIDIAPYAMRATT